MKSQLQELLDPTSGAYVVSPPITFPAYLRDELSDTCLVSKHKQVIIADVFPSTALGYDNVVTGHCTLIKEDAFLRQLRSALPQFIIEKRKV